MFFTRTIILAAFLAILVLQVESSFSGGSGGSYNYDLSKMSELTKLYNSKVYKVDRMRRPLEGTSFQLGIISHSGVRATLADGSMWLVHKGKGFGISSQTVVVDARHMGRDWKIVETKNFRGSKTISDFVKAGGTDYSLIFDNCHDGAGRMWE
ncbi:hypothetical protein DPEC_G00140920 [Dallia pectoralis]|uniref:Uncharacterized protein n=1 Tax=Dallia pectoralis TaxID=75939 RepID=A0ACC2GN53_DALPE|nr:hypothetical protein DPEC_G00140920 [Dallia pectoralis]